MIMVIFLSFMSLLAISNAELPMLSVGGFSWAENLVFDGLGGLYASEMHRGELIRISLCEDKQTYCQAVHVSGFSNIGGLAVSPDGNTIYAAVSWDNKTNGIIAASTKPPTPSQDPNSSTYTIIGKTTKKPNGMQLYNGVFYCTEEGGIKGNGSVFTLDLATGTEQIVHTAINADGAWLDINSKRLFIGQVKSMNVAVFNVSSNSRDVVYDGNFNGPAGQINHPELQILDDLTLDFKGGQSSGPVGSLANTQLLGADWLGKKLLRFSLDGSSMTTVSVPDDVKLKELTSVRWGKGPGFDEDSVYVSEGGGMTKHVTSRRIVQIKMIG